MLQDVGDGDVQKDGNAGFAEAVDADVRLHPRGGAVQVGGAGFTPMGSVKVIIPASSHMPGWRNSRMPIIMKILQQPYDA